MDRWLKGAPALVYLKARCWVLVNTECEPILTTEDLTEACWYSETIERMQRSEEPLTKTATPPPQHPRHKHIYGAVPSWRHNKDRYGEQKSTPLVATPVDAKSSFKPRALRSRD